MASMKHCNIIRNFDLACSSHCIQWSISMTGHFLRTVNCLWLGRSLLFVPDHQDECSILGCVRGQNQQEGKTFAYFDPGTGEACRMVDIQFALMLMLRKWREVQVKTWWYMSPKTVHAVKMLAMILDNRQRSKQPATARIPGPSRTSYGPTSAVNSTEGMRGRIFASFFWIPVLNNWGNEMGGKTVKKKSGKMQNAKIQKQLRIVFKTVENINVVRNGQMGRKFATKRLARMRTKRKCEIQKKWYYTKWNTMGHTWAQKKLPFHLYAKAQKLTGVLSILGFWMNTRDQIYFVLGGEINDTKKALWCISHDSK